MTFFDYYSSKNWTMELPEDWTLANLAGLKYQQSMFYFTSYMSMFAVIDFTNTIIKTYLNCMKKCKQNYW